MKKYIIVVVLVAITLSCSNQKYHQDQGRVFGTFYNIIYQSDKNYEKDIVELLDAFGKSLSTYDSTSLISNINRNISFETDSFFRVVFLRSKEIFEITDGAFDITIAPVVNLWGFGFSKADEVTDDKIDSLLKFVGFENVALL